MAREHRDTVMNKFHSMVIVTAAACALCLLLAACGMSTEEQWQEQYDLGEQYLLEGDYEQAIVAFTAAIEIDPNVADAYLGRADAYYVLGTEDIDENEEQAEIEDLTEAEQSYLTAALDNYEVVLELGDASEDTCIHAAGICVIMGDYDHAAEILAEGEEVHPDSETIPDMAEKVAVLIEERERQALIAEQRQQVEDVYWDMLMDLIDLLKGGSIRESIGAEDWFGDDFRKFLSSLSTELIFELEDGYYLGVYPGGVYKEGYYEDEDRYISGYIYYGEMENGLRSGYGVWFTSKDLYSQLANIVYDGEWEEDYPNGTGVYTELRNMGEAGVEYWQFTINFVDGYADGPGTFYAITSVGKEGECSIQAISGELQALYTSGDDEYCAQLPGISWPVRSLSVPGAVSGDIDITQE